MPQALRVFIADDSATSRIAFRRLITSDPGFFVVGEASDGRAAVEEIARKRPQVVLMDIVMPRMDGLEATRTIMAQHPTPVVLISDLVGRDANLNFKALQAGALDLLRKPSAEDLADAGFRKRFLRDLRLWSEVPLITRRATAGPAPKQSAPTRKRSVNPPYRASAAGIDPELVCIGASTGGPPALARLLADIGTEPPWPILIVQHITSGFVTGLGRWLTETTPISVSVAEHGETIRKGRAYLAPDERHLVLRGDILYHDAGAPCKGHRPSVDVLFESVAAGGRATSTVAVLLTGMGSDGAQGLSALRSAGAWTIAQDEASSVVYGMPREAIQLGAAREVLPLEEIGGRLGRSFGGKMVQPG